MLSKTEALPYATSMEPWSKQATVGMVVLIFLAVIVRYQLPGQTWLDWIQVVLVLAFGVLWLNRAWQRRQMGSVLGAAFEALYGTLCIIAGLFFV